MHKADLYAQALFWAWKEKKEGEEKHVGRFLNILKQRGDLYLLPRIVKVLERKESRVAETRIVSRFTLTEELRRKIISFLRQEFGAIDERSVAFATDETILGGVRILHKDFLYDATARNMLNQLST